MMNPPFPYQVVIRRAVAAPNPFVVAGEAGTIVYEGACDFENNRFPSVKDGVQVGKYKLYIANNTIPIEIADTVEITMFGRVIKGSIVDFTPTNFGMTVIWDNINN